MNALVHPLKRKKPGRKKGPPTDTITIRVSEGHKELFEATIPKKQRRPWLEKQIDQAARANARKPRKTDESAK